MSKLNVDNLKKAITEVIAGSQEKKRKFLDTVELQIGLKDQYNAVLRLKDYDTLTPNHAVQPHSVVTPRQHFLS